MIAVPIYLRREPGKVMAGAGLLSRTAGNGRRRSTVIYAASGRKSFQGAWWCEATMEGDTITATVAQGFVNGLEPVAASGKLVSEGTVQGVFGQDESGNAAEKAWVVVKVQVEPLFGKMLAKNQEGVSPDNLCVEILPDVRGDAGLSGIYGYAPLALLQKKAGVLHVYQIAYFSYRHNTARRNFVGTWRHFFHVA